VFTDCGVMHPRRCQPVTSRQHRRCIITHAANTV